MFETMRKYFIYFLLLLFSTTFSWGQNPLQTSVDTTSIKIGDVFLLTLKAQSAQGTLIHFPESEQLGAFEVLDNYPIDTILKNGTYELIKKYGLTQFDSGHFQLPALPVIIDNHQFKTEPIAIAVLGVEVDTIKQPMYEIKTIAASNGSFDSDWFYLIFALLFILVGIGLYFYIKKRQEANLTEDDLYKSPYEKAAKKLKSLEEKKHWTRGDPKPYYSDMTSIARSFIEDTFDISAHELTTQETVAILKQTFSQKKIKIDKNVVEEFKKVLQTADLVKFAKSQPQEFEITADTEKIQKIIDTINIAYPISIETQTERIRQREERKKKRLRFRALVPLSITSFLLLLVGGIYVINNASQDSFTKIWNLNSSKRLLNGAWITSTYGAPGITLSTPKVLVRHNDPTIQQTLPEGVSRAQQFHSGAVSDRIQILLNSITLDQSGKFDKKLILSHTINILTQNLQAEEVTYEKTDFENVNGMKGTKATGSFKIELKNKEVTMAFEMVLFIKNSSIDEVCVIYPEGDAVGAEIATKTFDSIIYIKDRN